MEVGGEGDVGGPGSSKIPPASPQFNMLDPLWHARAPQKALSMKQANRNKQNKNKIKQNRMNGLDVQKPGTANIQGFTDERDATATLCGNFRHEGKKLDPGKKSTKSYLL